MIYLFCNQKYGLPFLAAASEASRSFGIEVRPVLSERGTLPRPGGPSAALRRLAARAGLLLRFRSRYGLSPAVVADVNAEDFLAGIGSEAHGIVAGFNQVFKAAAIRRFRTLVNFHPSVLPLYRGPVPSYWCLHNGETRTGWTLHCVTEEVDAGEALHQETVEIFEADDEESLDRRIAERAARILPAYIGSLVGGPPLPRKVADAGAVYATRVGYASFPQKEDG